ncbi:MAG: prepilin peptidase [Lachnospiraceae bacterium]|nr:prepilin peptidase [Lachnospiraceae bacterium]
MIVVMEGILWLLRFAVGACVFSFLNVVVYRLPKGEPMTWGRSHCPDCGRTLTARELIPCLSYLIQGKKCLGCGKKISARYFWVEAAGGMCFVFCGVWFGYGIFGLLSLKGLIAFGYLGLLTVISLIDWDTKMINDRFQAGIVLLGLAALWIFPEHTLMERLIGAVIVALPMLLLALAVAGAFGGGDIKLMAASGFLLGWRAVLVAMFLGLLAGGIYAIWLLSRKKLKGKDQIAFGPFLSFGLGVALFYGDRIADWYLSIL